MSPGSLFPPNIPPTTSSANGPISHSSPHMGRRQLPPQHPHHQQLPPPPPDLQLQDDDYYNYPPPPVPAGYQGSNPAQPQQQVRFNTNYWASPGLLSGLQHFQDNDSALSLDCESARQSYYVPNIGLHNFECGRERPILPLETCRSKHGTIKAVKLCPCWPGSQETACCKKIPTVSIHFGGLSFLLKEGWGKAVCALVIGKLYLSLLGPSYTIPVPTLCLFSKKRPALCVKSLSLQCFLEPWNNLLILTLLNMPSPQNTIVVSPLISVVFRKLNLKFWKFKPWLDITDLYADFLKLWGVFFFQSPKMK